MTATREIRMCTAGEEEGCVDLDLSPGRGARAENIALAAAFMAYLAIALVVAANHEPWRDEADIWLFARDAGPGEWWNFFRHTGHPGLWLLVVRSISKLGLPYASITFMNVGIVSAGIAIFLCRSVLPLRLKLLLPFGVLPLYEYGVVARSYGLSFTLSMATCAALASRRPRPVWIGVLLALLANTNVHSVILATGFGLYWAFDSLRERASDAPLFSPRVQLGMAIAVAGGLASVAQVIPPDDPQVFMLNWKTERVVTRALTDAYFPRVGRSLGGPLGAALLGMIVPLVRRRRELLAFLLASVGGLMLLFLFVYPPFPRHAGFLWIALICLLWLERCSPSPSTRWRSRVTWAVTFSLIFSAVEGVRLSALDYRRPFSASREAAELLSDLDLESAAVAAFPATIGEAVLPYLPIRQFYYPGIEAMGSYLHWNTLHSSGERLESSLAVARARRAFPEPHPLVFITNTVLEQPELSGLTLRHRTASPPADFKEEEHYFIYTSGTVKLRAAR